MARGRSIRDLFVRIGFDADDAPLRRIDRGVNSLKSNLRLLRTGLFAAFGAGGAAGLLLNLAGQFEQTELSFEVLLGSAEKAKALLQDLFNFAKTTPFEIRDVLGAAKQLKAFGFETEELLPTLKRLGDVAAGVTRPGERLSDTFNRIALNFGQVRTQTRLLGKDANQFAIAGIPIFEEISKVMGVATENVRDLGQKGQISFDIVEQAFINMSSEGGQFFNLMERQSKTFLGIISNIKDLIVLVSADIGKALLPQARKLLNLFLGFVETSKEAIIKKGRQIFTDIGKGMLFALRVAKDLGSTLLDLTEIFGGLENTIKLVTIALLSMFTISVLSGIGNLTIGIVSLALAFTRLGNAAAIAQIKAVALPLLVGVGLVALGLIIDDIIGKVKGKDSLIGLIEDAFEVRFPKAFSKAKRDLEDFLNTMKIFFDTATSGFKTLFGFLTFKVPEIPLPTIGGFNRLLNQLTGGALSGISNLIGQGDVFGLNPATSPATTTATTINRGSSVVFGDINITAPPGADAEEIGRVFKEDILPQAYRNLQLKVLQ
jgi:tape measure domain-containing protein